MHVAGNSTIVAATAADVPFLVDLAKKYSNAVGFIPREALGVYVDRGGVMITQENDDPAGYILSGTHVAADPTIVPIYQAAVAMDAQRRHHGLALVEQLAAKALHRGQHILQCWCRTDLEATAFWKAAGFVAVATRYSENARRHPCILWRRPLTAVKREDFTAVEPPRKRMAPGGRWLSSNETAVTHYALHMPNVPRVRPTIPTTTADALTRPPRQRQSHATRPTATAA